MSSRAPKLTVAQPIKGSSDKKEYKSLLLANQMRVLLISDKGFGKASEPAEFDPLAVNEEAEEEEAEDEEDMDVDEEGDESEEEGECEEGDYKAAASLSVHWGSAVDPVETQGLMHFLEHMVFMGSHKYPNENSFDEFISAHGGYDNAFTDMEHTNFQFTVMESYLQEALDRFSQFFFKPLMKENAMNREREAVDSEYSMARVKDGNKEALIIGSMAPEGHPYSLFSWGNKETLSRSSDKVINAQLWEAFGKYYQPGYMALAVQSRHSIEEMQQWVNDSFSQSGKAAVTSKPSYSHLVFPFPPERINKVIRIKPIRAKHIVCVYCFLPSYKDKYEVHPMRLLAQLIGHEGTGSLLTYLKSKNWACELGCACELDDSDNNSLYTTLTVEMELSDEGYAHMDSVLLALFQYMSMLQKNCPGVDLFREYQKIPQLNFDYSPEVDAVENVEELSSSMLRYKPEHYLSGSSLLFEFDDNVIREAINHLTYDNALITIKSQNLDFSGQEVKTERYFKGEYTVSDLSDEWKALFSSATNGEGNAALHLPPPNPFLPSEFNLLPPASGSVSKYPTCIEKSKCGSMLYYKPDYKFGLPFVYLKIEFLLKDEPCRHEAKFHNVMLLFTELFKYQFTEHSYPASLAMYNYDLKYTVDGAFILQVEGFTQKIQYYLKYVLEHLANFEKNFKSADFETIKKQVLQRHYNNATKPGLLHKELRLNLLTTTECSLKHLTLTQEIREEEVVAVANSILSNIQIVMLAQGNLSQSTASTIFSDLKKHFSVSDTCDVTLKPLPGYRELVNGISVVCTKTPNAADGNSAVTNYYQGGKGSIRTQVLQSYLQAAIEERCFDELRTKEQLSYSVNAWTHDTNGVIGLSVNVTPQAVKFSTSYVDERIEKFFLVFEEQLRTMTEERFEVLKETVRRTKKVEDLSLSQEVSRNFGEIVGREFVFDRLEKQLAIVDTITKDQLLTHFQSLVAPSNASYRKLSVQVVGSEVPEKETPPSFSYLLEKGCNHLQLLPPPPPSIVTEGHSTKDCIGITDLSEYLGKMSSFPHHPIKE